MRNRDASWIRRRQAPVLAVLLAWLPTIAAAWWNDEWQYRKSVTVTMPPGADVNASAASPFAGALYDADTTAVSRFAESSPPLRDSTAYAQRTSESSLRLGVLGVVGSGAELEPSGWARLASAPVLTVSQSSSLTFSASLRSDDEYVIVSKAARLRRAEDQDAAFMTEFSRRFRRDVRAANDAADAGDTYRDSPVHETYLKGLRELADVRAATGAPARIARTSPDAFEAMRARLDSMLAESTNDLNSRLVLKTVAIAGAPFLGLLSTVIGVMITFASIAAAGDVNVNTIAPGVAAARMATVAGFCSSRFLYGSGATGLSHGSAGGSLKWRRRATASSQEAVWRRHSLPGQQKKQRSRSAQMRRRARQKSVRRNQRDSVDGSCVGVSGRIHHYGVGDGTEHQRRAAKGECGAEPGATARASDHRGIRRAGLSRYDARNARGARESAAPVACGRSGNARRGAQRCCRALRRGRCRTRCR